MRGLDAECSPGKAAAEPLHHKWDLAVPPAIAIPKKKHGYQGILGQEVSKLPMSSSKSPMESSNRFDTPSGRHLAPRRTKGLQGALDAPEQGPHGPLHWEMKPPSCQCCARFALISIRINQAGRLVAVNCEWRIAIAPVVASAILCGYQLASMGEKTSKAGGWKAARAEIFAWLS